MRDVGDGRVVRRGARAAGKRLAEWSVVTMDYVDVPFDALPGRVFLPTVRSLAGPDEEGSVAGV